MALDGCGPAHSDFGTGCWGFESLLGHHHLGLSNAKRGEYLSAFVCAIQPSYSQTFCALRSGGIVIHVLVRFCIGVILFLLIPVLVALHITAEQCI
jgi:hypothetical protein